MPTAPRSATAIRGRAARSGRSRAAPRGRHRGAGRPASRPPRARAASIIMRRKRITAWSEVPRCSFVRSTIGPIDSCTAWSSLTVPCMPESRSPKRISSRSCSQRFSRDAVRLRLSSMPTPGTSSGGVPVHALLVLGVRPLDVRAHVPEHRVLVVDRHVHEQLRPAAGPGMMTETGATKWLTRTFCSSVLLDHRLADRGVLEAVVGVLDLEARAAVVPRPDHLAGLVEAVLELAAFGGDALDVGAVAGSMRLRASCR